MEAHVDVRSEPRAPADVETESEDDEGGRGSWDGDGDDYPDPDPYDKAFSIPRSEDFASNLSSYGLYAEPLSSLQPAPDVFLYELGSELFTDHAYKQRLVRLPSGTQVLEDSDGRFEYPEGAILAKTFYYPLDMRESAGPRRILETRLLVKTGGQWNVATYVWNDDQTDATLLLDGLTTTVTWIDEGGEPWSTDYVIPHEGECVTCHQSSGEVAYIGPTAPNLNRTVVRGATEVEQLEHLASVGVVPAADWAAVLEMPNYADATHSLESRARAYLDINCAHCHSPGGWDQANDPDPERKIDLRYTATLDESGLKRRAQKFRRQLQEGEMPYLGTTLKHDAGVQLVLDYIESL